MSRRSASWGAPSSAATTSIPSLIGAKSCAATGSQAVEVAALGYAAGADNITISRELEPKPAAPMPCDVVPYMKDMRLPELPASLDPGPPIQGQGRGLRG